MQRWRLYFVRNGEKYYRCQDPSNKAVAHGYYDMGKWHQGEALDIQAREPGVQWHLESVK